MKKQFIIGITAALCLWAAPATVAQKESVKGKPQAKPPRDYPVKPVPFTAVHFNDVFWAPRIEINRTVTIPFAFEKCEETKRIYNFERADGQARNLLLPDGAKLLAEFRPDLLGGVTVIKSRSVALSFDAEGNTLKKERDFTAIPYYAWANRGRGEMIVWIPNKEANARPRPFPTIATTSKVTVSGRRNQRLDPRRINDGEEPASSSDAGSYFDWWPTKGSTEWVEYAFEKPATVSQVEVYWFDDTGRGDVRVPQSWRVLYKDGDEWKPVEKSNPYGVDKDRYNKVVFKPTLTTGLRLEIIMQPNWSAGLQEWKVK